MATVARMQREAESAAAARRRAESAAQREAARTRAAYERARAADEKERKRLYFEARVAEVAAQNESLAQRLEELDSILVSGLRTATRFNLNRLKEKPNVKPFDPGRPATPNLRRGRRRSCHPRRRAWPNCSVGHGTRSRSGRGS